MEPKSLWTQIAELRRCEIGSRREHKIISVAEPRRPRAPFLLLCAALIACTSTSSNTLDATTVDAADDLFDGSSEPVSLIDNTVWESVAPENDPFWPEARTPENLCLPEHFGPEDKPDGIWFEVQTENCAYLTVTQELLHDIKKGDLINFRLWHFSVTIGSQDYYLAISLGVQSKLFWEGQVPVPSDSHLFYGTIEATETLPAGSPIYFHISNHGSNDWGLIEFSKTL